MNKTVADILYWSMVAIILAFVIAMSINNSHAAGFSSYQYVELADLTDHADKWNDQEVQIRGQIHKIDQYTGAYGGEYVGLKLGEGITVFFYAKTGVDMLVEGDMILVDGTYHKWSKFGGQSHDYFITTHRLQRLQ